MGGVLGTIAVLAVLSAAAQEPIEYRVVSGPRAGERMRLVSQAPRIGYVPLPGVRVRAVQRAGDRVLFDAQYTIDERSRRYTPYGGARRRTRHVLLFGCSFAFGEGVNDDQTLLARLAERMPDSVPYNYGFTGYGPQQMLARLESGVLPAEVPERQGVALYLFIDAHIGRAVGSLKTAGGKHTPCYERSGDGVAFKGLFEQAHPWRMALCDLALRSRLIRRTIATRDLPPATGRDAALTARLIKAAHDRYRSQFPAGAFYVVIWPGEGERIRKHLAREGVPFMELAHARLTPGRFELPDSHPSPAAYRVVAALIARGLRARGQAAP